MGAGIYRGAIHSRRIPAMFTNALTIVLSTMLALAAAAPMRAAAPAPPTAPAASSMAPPLDDTAKSNYKAARLNLPMSYEANRGQFDDRVSYVGRSKGLSLFVGGSETVLQIAGDSRAANVRMRLEGASTIARADGV